MRSAKPRLPSAPSRPFAGDVLHLPWLPPDPPRPSRRPPSLSNSAVLRLITAPTATPNDLLSIYSRAARQPGFRHDYPTYSALIPSLARHRRLGAASLLVSRMRRHGLRPGPSLLLPLLSALSSAHLPPSTLSRLLLSNPPSPRALSALISAGHLDAALALITDLGLPIPITLIRDLCDRGSIQSAVDLLDLMAVRNPNSVPDVHFYGALIRGLPPLAAFAVVDQMKRVGREPDSVVWNTLVHACVREGDVGRAEELVAKMEWSGAPRDAGTYNVLIAGVVEFRSVEDAFKVFNGMQQKGVSPDVITFSTLMGRLGKDGRVFECDGLFGKMMKMGVKPDAVCFRILFSGYRKSGIVHSEI